MPVDELLKNQLELKDEELEDVVLEEDEIKEMKEEDEMAGGCKCEHIQRVQRSCLVLHDALRLGACSRGQVPRSCERQIRSAVILCGRLEASSGERPMELPWFSGGDTAV